MLVCRSLTPQTTCSPDPTCLHHSNISLYTEDKILLSMHASIGMCINLFKKFFCSVFVLVVLALSEAAGLQVITESSSAVFAPTLLPLV